MEQIHALRFGQLLDALADRTPAPGGGAVAAAVGGLAAALAGMVTAYSLGKRTPEEHEPTLREAMDHLARARTDLLRLADADAEAYARLSEVMKMPKENPGRAEAFPGAVEAALDVPRAVLARCEEITDRLHTLAAIGNARLRSDLAIAALCTSAAAGSAVWMIRANLPMLDDEAKRRGVNQEAERVLASIRDACTSVEKQCEQGG